MTDIVERLKQHPDTGAWDDAWSSYARGQEAADRIKALEARIAKANALAREVERIATHRQKQMGVDYWQPHHPKYPHLFRRLAAYHEGTDT